MQPLGLAHLAVLEIPPQDLIPLARRAGYAATGLRVNPAAPGTPFYPLRPADLAETRRRLASEGMRIAEVELVPLSGGTRVQDYEWMMELGATLGASSVTVSGDDKDFDRLVDVFGAFCDLAHRYGLWVDIEFMRWRPVATLENAVEIVSRAGRSNGGILIDALHLFRSGGSAAALARVDPKFIRNVQLCDAPLDLPESMDLIAEARGARLLTGEGELPLNDLMDALPANVTISTEIPMSLTQPRLAPLDRIQLAYEATARFLAGRS
jgi:sugar phosphate isomerase/epimerase